MTQKISQILLIVIVLSSFSSVIKAVEPNQTNINKDEFYIKLVSEKTVEEQNKKIRQKLQQNQALIKTGQMGTQDKVQIPNITARKWLEKIEEMAQKGLRVIEEDIFQVNTFTDRALEFSEGVNETLISMNQHLQIKSPVLLNNVKANIDLSRNLINLARMYYERDMSQLDFLINHSSVFIAKKAQKAKGKYQFIDRKIFKIQKRIQTALIRVDIYERKNQTQAKKQEKEKAKSF